MKADLILCLDVGNTRVKWGVCHLADLTFIETGVLKSADDFTSDELLVELKNYKPMPVWVSSVASSKVRKGLGDWFHEHWAVKVNYIEALDDRFKGLNNYRVKTDFGIDRWLALVAAQWRYQNHYCVIDVGTAVTVDVVGVDGKHRGGVIMPGKKLLLSALNNGAAGVDVISGKIAMLADGTSDAVVSGVILSLVGGVERTINTIKKEYKEITFVLTGGDAELIEQALNIEIKIEKNLVLEGVGLIARNKYA